ncbi:MAG TPA: ATP-binding protein [Kofleriaceae bacterium]|nr:ATP-binding protein [Kofleriaceae bacterium]
MNTALQLSELLRLSLFGLAIYLAAQQALMLLRGRERAIHALALLLSLNAAAFLLLRYWHRLQVDGVDPANLRAQFTTALLVGPLGLGFLHALRGRALRGRPALALAAGAALALTPWCGDIVLRFETDGSVYLQPLAALALAPYVVGLCAAVVWSNRSVDAHLWRAQRRLLPFTVAGFLLASLNDIAVQAGALSGGLYLEYAFAFHLISVGYGLTNRLETMHEDMEATVLTRTGELEAALEKLARADRMSTIGTLSAGIAHEINNPLSYVLGNIEMVREGLGDPDAERDELVKILGEAHEGAERVRRIVGDLRTFSRPPDVGLGPVSVGKAVQVALNLTGAVLRQRAQLVVDIAPSACVMASEGRLVQVLVNLLINAGQAVKDRPRLDHVIGVHARPDGDDRVIIEVTDSGRGIARSVLPRVFDPFFTTKPVGVGTGLGLSICHGIVTGFRGELTLENRAEGGAVARIILPRARPRDLAAPAVAVAA